MLKKIKEIIISFLVMGVFFTTLGSCFGEEEEKRKPMSEYTNEELITHIMETSEIITPKNVEGTIEDAVYAMASDKNLRVDTLEWEVIENGKNKVIKAHVWEQAVDEKISYEMDVFFPINKDTVRVYTSDIYSEYGAKGNLKKTYLSDLNNYATRIWNINFSSLIKYEGCYYHTNKVLDAIYSQYGIFLPEDLEELDGWKFVEDKENRKKMHVTLTYNGLEVKFIMENKNNKYYKYIIDADYFTIKYNKLGIRAKESFDHWVTSDESLQNLSTLLEAQYTKEK